MELTPEQINEFIAKAILESQLGECVRQSVKRVIEECSRTYNNPFDAVIKKHVEAIIDQEIMNQYRPVIEEGIKSSMAKYMTDEVIQSFIKAAFDKLRRDY